MLDLDLKYLAIEYLKEKGFEFEYAEKKEDKYQESLRDEAFSPLRYDGKYYWLQFKNIRFWFERDQIVKVKEMKYGE